MDTQEYVTKDEVKKVCSQLNLRDWSELKNEGVSIEEAEIIRSEVNIEKMNIDIEDFRQGLEVELEHGTRYKNANITNNHPLLTGKIVIAHLKESLDYYKLLEVAELEGDLIKAIKTNDILKIKDKYKKLISAKLKLNQSIFNQLS